jgi:hypothetical protein
MEKLAAAADDLTTRHGHRQCLLQCDRIYRNERGELGLSIGVSGGRVAMILPRSERIAEPSDEPFCRCRPPRRAHGSLPRSELPRPAPGSRLEDAGPEGIIPGRVEILSEGSPASTSNCESLLSLRVDHCPLRFMRQRLTTPSSPPNHKRPEDDKTSPLPPACRSPSRAPATSIPWRRNPPTPDSEGKLAGKDCPLSPVAAPATTPMHGEVGRSAPSGPPSLPLTHRRWGRGVGAPSFPPPGVLDAEMEGVG